jgi:hypothetical protein
MDRAQVTGASVRNYMDANLDRTNYHLFYGLHLLPRDRFLAVMDALLNNELQPEELVRLGGFTAAEADSLLKDSLGSWTNPSVAQPVVGTDGYTYLAETLGLAQLVKDASLAVAGPAASRTLGAHVRIGGRDGHINEAAAESIFRSAVLPAALGVSALESVLPGNEAEYRALPCAAGAQDQAWLWGSGVFGPLISPDDGLLLRRLVWTGMVPSSLQLNPALAEWVITTPMPAYDTHLLLHRVAVERTVAGPYTSAELSALLDELESARPNHVGTSRKISFLDLKVRIARAAAAHHFPDDAVLNGRAAVLTGAMQQLTDHRAVLRSFMAAVLAGCASNLLGDYPPG